MDPFSQIFGAVGGMASGGPSSAYGPAGGTAYGAPVTVSGSPSIGGAGNSVLMLAGAALVGALLVWIVKK